MRDDRRIIVVEDDAKANEGMATVFGVVFVVVMGIAWSTTSSRWLGCRFLHVSGEAISLNQLSGLQFFYRLFVQANSLISIDPQADP
jgi:hypothetical protein